MLNDDYNALQPQPSFPQPRQQFIVRDVTKESKDKRNGGGGGKTKKEKIECHI